MTEYKFEQIFQIASNDIDGGGDHGPEYTVHYTVYETQENGPVVYELSRDDGNGNGVGIAQFYRKAEAIQAAKLFALQSGQPVDIFREFDECLDRLNKLMGDK